MLIRPYQPGDEHKIVAMFRQVFGMPMPLEYWHWRFGDDNPWGSTVVVAMDGDTLAAHYAVSHQQAEHDGHVFLTAQSMTTMVGSAYRGKGLFVKCASMCYGLAMGDGVKFVWGFPNRNSEHGFYSRLGWELLGNVGLLLRAEGSRCTIGASGHQEWRWGDSGIGPEYGGLLLDEDYREAFEALELHLEDSDAYTYDRDCRRLTA